MKKGLLVFAVIMVFAGCTEAKKTDGVKAVSQQEKTAVSSVENPLIATGLASLQKGDIKAAIKSFDDAIRENPKDVQGYLILGQTYMHLKDYNRAVDTFLVATRVDPQNGQAHYLLATNLGLAGNYTLARAQAEKSVEIFRKNKDGNNFKRAIALLQGLPQAQSVEK